MFEYSVTYDEAEGLFEARVPYRQCVWLAETEVKAVGCLIEGVAELAYSGSLDPEAPTRNGAAPIQHAINVLSKALASEIEARRYASTEISSSFPGGQAEPPDAETQRRSELISGIATAIAALARVKAL